MISEENYKHDLLNRLNVIYSGWIDGDKESKNCKSADIVNHLLKIAIEIKDDTNYIRPKPPLSGEAIATFTNLREMNERLSDHLRSANLKFKEYFGYKTILIFRSEYFPQTIKYALLGLDTYKKPFEKLEYIGRTGKYSEYIRRKISCFLLAIEDKYYYFSNPEMEEKWVSTDRKEIIDIFGLQIEEI